MGMIQCSDHGLCHIVLTCRHVDLAISEKRALVILSIDDDLFSSKLWMCNECAMSFMSSESDDKYDILVPVCSVCFEKWHI